MVFQTAKARSCKVGISDFKGGVRPHPLIIADLVLFAIGFRRLRESLQRC